MMEAIVLAGGYGTRLKAVVPDLPKPMAPIGGRPFLEILLAGLAANGFSRVVLSLGHMADVIRNHFGAQFANMEIVYEIEESPLGTGGAVRQAMEHVLSDHVYVLNGDTYLALKASAVERLWKTFHQPIILAREVSDTSRFGRIEVSDGIVVKFCEKGIGGGGMINAGCYVLQRETLNSFALGTPFSLEQDFLEAAVRRSVFRVSVSRGQFIDIGVPEDYLRAQSELASQIYFEQ